MTNDVFSVIYINITDTEELNMKEDLKRKMANVTSKSLFGLALALTLSCCDAEPSPSDLAYMSPSERYEYDNYGIVPNDITAKAKAKQKTGILCLLGLGAAISLGVVLGGKNTKSR